MQRTGEGRRRVGGATPKRDHLTVKGGDKTTARLVDMGAAADPATSSRPARCGIERWRPMPSRPRAPTVRHDRTCRLVCADLCSD